MGLDQFRDAGIEARELLVRGRRIEIGIDADRIRRKLHEQQRCGPDAGDERTHRGKVNSR